jgi:hypothetical protein
MALFQKSVVAQRDVYAQRSGVPWCNGAIGDIAQNGPREWKKRSGYHRRLPVENTLYRWLIWGGRATSVHKRPGYERPLSTNSNGSLARRMHVPPSLCVAHQLPIYQA